MKGQGGMATRQTERLSIYYHAHLVGGGGGALSTRPPPIVVVTPSSSTSSPSHSQAPTAKVAHRHFGLIIHIGTLPEGYKATLNQSNQSSTRRL